MLRRLCRTGAGLARRQAVSASAAPPCVATCAWFPQAASAGPMRVPSPHPWGARHATTLRRGLKVRAASAPPAPPAPPPEDRTTEVELASEASTSYLAYAMSVIVGRALPDVRDGLKPVHRCVWSRAPGGASL